MASVQKPDGGELPPEPEDCYDCGMPEPDCVCCADDEGVAVALLVAGYLTLLLLCCAAAQSFLSSLEAYPTAVKVGGRLMLLWIWGFPLLSSPLLFMKDLIHAIWALSLPKF